MGIHHPPVIKNTEMKNEKKKVRKNRSENKINIKTKYFGFNTRPTLHAAPVSTPWAKAV